MSDRTDSVTLPVSTDLVPPQGMMATESLQVRIASLVERCDGLVDAGGQMTTTAHDTVIAFGHRNGFISAVTNAFANHYPLALSPQHIWLCILQATAKHVELNSEAVRSKWVAHEGKKELVVRCDHFVLGESNDWASVVDAADGFAAQIDAHLVDGGMASLLVPSFSGTTDAERIAQKITVMDVTKSFFSFKFCTSCGFPSVTLEGTAEDWKLLRDNAETLVRERCTQQWGHEWLSALLPLLDKFNLEYAKGSAGEIGDEAFWNSMCKRGGTQGSGARTWFNGWINILFPYIENRPNQYAVPYSADAGYVKEGRKEVFYGMRGPPGVQGPDCADFPTGIAAAPVTWKYYRQEFKLEFKAGFLGASQDPATGTIRPRVGWYIAHESKQTQRDGDEWMHDDFKPEGQGGFLFPPSRAAGRGNMAAFGRSKDKATQREKEVSSRFPPTGAGVSGKGLCHTLDARANSRAFVPGDKFTDEELALAELEASMMSDEELALAELEELALAGQGELEASMM